MLTSFQLLEDSYGKVKRKVEKNGGVVRGTTLRTTDHHALRLEVPAGWNYATPSNRWLLHFELESVIP